MNRVLARAAGWLPAIFWAAYVLWNAVLTTPPAWGALTPFTLMYLLMLPATLLMVAQLRRASMAGQWTYVAFLIWLAAGVLWRGSAAQPDILKALVVCALVLPIAAQMVVGGSSAPVTFAATVALTALGTSVMTIWQALASGFQYRAGTTINANFVATMVALGLLTALAFHLRRHDDVFRRGLLAIVLICGYAIMLLGSRGVLIALIASAGALFLQVRPSLRSVRGLMLGAAAVVTIAQLPMIPHALWQAGWHAASAVHAAASRMTESRSPPPPAPAPASASAPAAVRLNSAAARSNALARFVERDTATLNKRTGLWRALATYIATQPSVLLFGGGLGISREVVHRADPVFYNAHNAYLQVLAEAGLVGAGLLAWTVWAVMRRLRAIGTALAQAWLALLVFWMAAAVTATVIDLHVLWCTLGVAMASTVMPTVRVRCAPPRTDDRDG